MNAFDNQFGKTRAQVAKELVQRLERGPSFHTGMGELLTPAEATAIFKRWSESWIIEPAKALLKRDLETRCVKRVAR